MSEEKSKQVKPDDESSGQNPQWPGEGPELAPKPGTEGKPDEDHGGEQTSVPVVR